MTLLDRRHLYRGIGSTFDNVIVPPIVIDPPPVTPPDPNPPPVVRGNYGQQRSAYVHALNAARQETHGHPVNIISADPTKVRIDAILGNIVLFTVLDESAVINLTGDVGGVAVPTIKATGLTTPAEVPLTGMVGRWTPDNVVLSGSEVISITDSGANSNGNTLTKTGATGPTLVTNVLNGFNGIRHATSQSLQKINAVGLSGSDITIVVVHSPYPSTTAGSMTMYDFNNGKIHLNVGNGQNGDYRIGGPYNNVWPGTNAVWRGNSVVNTFDIVVVTRTGGNETFYKNGATALTPVTNRADGIGTSSTITAGGDFVGNFGSGTWVEYIIYDHALSSTDINTVFQVLGNKYNIPVLATSGTLINRASWVATAWADGGGGFVPASAIDSNIGTRYLSATNVVANVSWFKIDLGSAQMVGGVQCDNDPVNGGGWAQPKAGKIQYSDDNSSWTDVGATWQLATVPTTVQASWTPQSHRYWRLLATDVSSDGAWWSIGELYLFSDRAP